MGLGGGANLSLHPPFRHKGDAPDPLAMGLMGGGFQFQISDFSFSNFSLFPLNSFTNGFNIFKNNNSKVLITLILYRIISRICQDLLNLGKLRSHPQEEGQTL